MMVVGVVVCDGCWCGSVWCVKIFCGQQEEIGK